MKKTILLIACMYAITTMAQVTVSGKNIMVDGKKYLMRGVCFSSTKIGETWTNATDMGWPSYGKFATDLQLMKDACINTIRTYYPIFDKTTLDMCQAAGIKVIITFPYIDGRSYTGLTKYMIEDGSYQTYINAYKNHPAILMWSFGNETNYNYTAGTTDWNWWYSTINNAAAWAKANDTNHPTTTANGGVPTTEAINLAPNIDIWGINIYTTAAYYGAKIGEYSNVSSKPMYFSEYGVDAYNHTINAVDQAGQSTELLKIWNDLFYSYNNNQVASGGCIFEWCDEWFKSGDYNNQNIGGSAPGNFMLDGITDEEYYGIVDIYRNKRSVYTNLQNMWKSYCAVTVPSTNLMDDFECTRQLTYTFTDGPLTIVANPASNNVNTSSYCAKFERSTATYASILMSDGLVSDALDYRTNLKAFTMDVYSSKSGTPVTIVMQNATKATGAYPAGRHSTYLATTTKTNAWETLTFAYENRPDANTTDAEVNEIAVLFNSGVATAGQVYYFDNFKGPLATKTTDIGITTAATTYNDNTLTNGIAVTIKNNAATTQDLTTTPVSIFYSVTGAKTAQGTVKVNTGSLTASATTSTTVLPLSFFSAVGTYTISFSSISAGDTKCTNNVISPITATVTTTSIANTTQVIPFTVIPNPAKDIVTLQLDNSSNATYTLSITDLTGRVVLHQTINTEHASFSVASLNQGVYWIMVNNGQTTNTKKLVVVK